MAMELIPKLEQVNEKNDGLGFAAKVSSVGSALLDVARALLARTGKRRQSNECFTRRDVHKDAAWNLSDFYTGDSELKGGRDNV